MLGHRRNQLDRKENAERDDDQVIEVAKDKHKVRNDINGGEGIGGHTGSDGFCMPGHARIAGGKVKGMDSLL